MLGNEAIARGALEAGVGFAAAYPGTPSTEILEALIDVADEVGLHAEWSVNEKVAFEAAYASAIAGVRSLVAMKHVGLNVAADPLMSSAYTGVREGFLIVSADDPGMWSSQNEQDNRWYGLHALIPVVEPSDPAEAKELTVEALEMSSELEHPVILRITTRVAHTRAPVVFGKLRPVKAVGTFVKDVSRWALVPANARKRRSELVKRWRIVEGYVERFRFNEYVRRGSRLLVVGVGAAYPYVVESLKLLRAEDVSTLKLSTTVPIPRKLVLDALSEHEKVLVVEELEPVVEMLIKKAAYEEGLRVSIHGKDLVPVEGELSLEPVAEAIDRVLGLNRLGGLWEPAEPSVRVQLPPRPPVLCAGCPHRATFYALKRAVSKLGVKPVYSGDIGCYSLGLLKPFEMQDTLVDMGSSIGLASGFAHVLKDRLVVAIIGDSTFFHAGIPGLINCVYNKAPVLVLVMDNGVTAMTGHQPHPGTGAGPKGERREAVKVEDVASAAGLKFVRVFDPFDVRLAERVLEEAIAYVIKERRSALVVARRPCSLIARATTPDEGAKPLTYTVDAERCVGCGACYNALACPAISPRDDGRATIDEGMCVGCGVCAHVCPHGAIGEAERGAEA